MADEPMDPELAALLASLDAPAPPPAPPGAKKMAPVFGSAAKKTPAPSYGASSVPPPPPTGPAKVGSYLAAKKAAAGGPPPPPPMPGMAKASSPSSYAPKISPAASGVAKVATTSSLTATSSSAKIVPEKVLLFQPSKCSSNSITGSRDLFFLFFFPGSGVDCILRR
jgi:hypothetical protein